MATARFARYVRPIGDDGRTGVHVDHDHGVVVQIAKMLEDRRGHRFEHQPEPAGEEHRLVRQFERAGREVGRGRSIDVEEVRRAPVLVELDGGERARPLGAPGEPRVNTVGVESGGEQGAEPIGGQHTGESRRRPEARRGARRVVRRTPERRRDGSIGRDDQVDERLADHRDHACILARTFRRMDAPDASAPAHAIGAMRAAPTMPALFAICAATTSVSTCTFGSH